MTTATSPTSSSSTAAIELDPSQKEAIERTREWLDARLVDPKVQQVWRIGGHAGSGKTTIIRRILQEYPDLDIAVTTFTGKASEVLRSKGIDAINLHQIFYAARQDKIDERNRLLHELEECDDPAERARLQKMIEIVSLEMFERLEEIPHDLVVVDEASMVPGRITEDLLRYGKPVLAVGDPAQLPPIQPKWSELPPLFDDQPIDAMLTGQHRSGNGLVLECALAARGDEGLPDAVVVDPTVDYTDYNVVLVARNDTRWSVIREIRERLGKPVDRPVPGDEIMIFKNDHALQVFNGSTLYVHKVQDHPAKAAWLLETDRGDLLVDKRGFLDEKRLSSMTQGTAKPKVRKGVAVASFCEAITVHKAQGSEWSRVLVAEDAVRAGSRDNRVRWRYTAVTRARDVVHVVGPSFLEPVR